MVDSKHVNNNDEVHVQALVEKLEHQRREVIDEIASYPTPITGCDVQFNYLLEKRQQLSRSINQLKSKSS